MHGAGFEILARIPVTQLRPSYPSPAPSPLAIPPSTVLRLWLSDNLGHSSKRLTNGLLNRIFFSITTYICSLTLFMKNLNIPYVTYLLFIRLHELAPEGKKRNKHIYMPMVMCEQSNGNLTILRAHVFKSRFSLYD